ELGSVVGVDLAPEALQRAAERGLRSNLAQGSVERLPFRNASFDMLASFEVVYHLGVGDDLRALAEFRRVLPPGGLLRLRLPAHDWLRGEHDRLVHTRHRYTRDEVGRKLKGSGFAPRYLSWGNTILFPPAAAKRLLERLRPHPEADDTAAEPDLWQPPA